MLRKTSRFAALLALALGMAVAAPAAQAIEIEALVNGKPITDYDVTQRSKMTKLTGQSMSREAVLEELVQERLKVQEAARLGVTVPDADVDKAFADIATRTRMNPSQLTRALGQIGIDARTLKDRIRSQIAWNSVVRGRAAREARVEDQDIFAEMDIRGDGTRESTEYTLTQVTLIGPNARGRAAGLRSRFTSCEASLEELRGLKGVVLKNLGRRRSSEIGPENSKQLDETSVGRLSPPTEAEGGTRMFAVCDRRTVQDQSESREEVRRELAADKIDVASRRMVMELIQDAIIEYR